MKVHIKDADFDVNLFDIDVSMEDVSKYIYGQGEVEKDIEFLNHYLEPKKWRSTQEMKEILEPLSDGSKETLRQMMDVLHPGWRGSE